MVITETSAESLKMDTKKLPSDGTMMRIAWGRMIRRISSRRDMPTEAPASRCPSGIAWIPERNTFAM